MRRPDRHFLQDAVITLRNRFRCTGERVTTSRGAYATVRGIFCLFCVQALPRPTRPNTEVSTGGVTFRRNPGRAIPRACKGSLTRKQSACLGSVAGALFIVIDARRFPNGHASCASRLATETYVCVRGLLRCLDPWGPAARGGPSENLQAEAPACHFLAPGHRGRCLSRHGR